MAHPETDNPLGEELLEFIQRRLDESTLTFHTTLPPQRAQYAEWPEWVLPELKDKLVEGGVGKLYSHQAELAQAACASSAWCRYSLPTPPSTSFSRNCGSTHSGHCAYWVR